MDLLFLLTVVWRINLPFVDCLHRLARQSSCAVDGKAAIFERLRIPWCTPETIERQSLPNCRNLHIRKNDGYNTRSFASSCRLNEYCCWWLTQNSEQSRNLRLRHPDRSIWWKLDGHVPVFNAQWAEFVCYDCLVLWFTEANVRIFLYCKKISSYMEVNSATQNGWRATLFVR